MIKHIVSWDLKGENKKENGLEMKKRLEELKGLISEIKFIEVGINVNSTSVAKDIVLYSEFETLEDLESYQVNPHHVKAGEFVRSVTENRIVIDYEV
ncbi:MAG: Dabb family protein [Clostridium sp.]|uniref:Dabb family protein n=1 Tax=Clostridium sp. TaxID=1506 RepID=UPI003F3AA0C1